jgi:Family of unknown function (DUF5996)
VGPVRALGAAGERSDRDDSRPGRSAAPGGQRRQRGRSGWRTDPRPGLRATRAAQVLGEFRAPFRGRATPVNAWWGSFDLSVTLFSGRPAEPSADDFITRNAADAQMVEVGWWPGDRRYPRAAFYGFAFPAPDALSRASVSPPAARFDAGLGEFILDWDDVRAARDPRADALEFAHSVFRVAGTLGGWDEVLAGSLAGRPSPLRPPAAWERAR